MKRLIDWFTARPKVAIVFLLAVIAGPLFARYAFPGLEPWRYVAGGVVVGIYFAMCAIPQKLMD